MHNAIANKFKRNDDHLHNAWKHTNPKKIAIVQELHKNSIELRTMTALKNALFDSELVTESHLLPMEEFERIRVYETQNHLDSAKDMLIAQIKTSDGTMVNLKKLMDVIDLFTMLPMHKQMRSNASVDIYNVMSSGTQDGPTNERAGGGGPLKKLLDLLWIKLEERFKTIGNAFLHFDTDFNNSVEFTEF